MYLVLRGKQALPSLYAQLCSQKSPPSLSLFLPPNVHWLSLVRTPTFLQNPPMQHPNYTISPLLAWETPALLVSQLSFICPKLPWRLFCSRLKAETLGNADMDITFSVPLLGVLPSLKGNMNSQIKNPKVGCHWGAESRRVWRDRKTDLPGAAIPPFFLPYLPLTNLPTYPPTYL